MKPRQLLAFVCVLSLPGCFGTHGCDADNADETFESRVADADLVAIGRAVAAATPGDDEGGTATIAIEQRIHGSIDPGESVRVGWPLSAAAALRQDRRVFVVASLVPRTAAGVYRAVGDATYVEVLVGGQPIGIRLTGTFDEGRSFGQILARRRAGLPTGDANAVPFAELAARAEPPFPPGPERLGYTTFPCA